MDLQLKGKVALISGSTKGIGFASAKLMAAEGAKVIINGRGESAVKDAIAKIRAAHPQAEVDGFAADLATAAGANSLVAKLPDVDILVNNLGIFERKIFEDIDDAEWQRFFDINVMSGVRLSRAYLAGMKQRNWGRIVFVSSESGIHIPDNMIHYGMTKTAQMAISRGLAETCAGTAVTVNTVLPGPTLSEGNLAGIAKRAPGRALPEFEKEFFEKARPSSLLKRYATPDEVANMIAYVCSPLASATNGAALRVDGGVVRACFG
ncbi:MAG: SDR family oxidoreductase [Burkholderiales bacterium]|jgi:NAD(P)-dependent dehydrogenase (short-subunit alcohol dehydrogenase family)